MDRDSILLGKAEKGTLGARVYSWDGPWVSLGRSQDAARDLLPDNLVPFVKRPTGGQAVLHGHDATIGLAIPVSLISSASAELKPGIRSIYRAATKPIIEALKACGLDVALAVDTEWIKVRTGLPDCFAATSEMDIVNRKTGVKLCGCAMRRKREAVLLQASVPNGQPLVDPSNVFAESSSYVGPDWDSSQLKGSLEKALASWLRAG